MLIERLPFHKPVRDINTENQESLSVMERIGVMITEQWVLSAHFHLDGLLARLESDDVDGRVHLERHAWVVVISIMALSAGISSIVGAGVPEVCVAATARFLIAPSAVMPGVI